MRMYDRGPEMRLLCSCCNIHAVCQEHPPWEVDIGLPSRHKRGAAGGGGGGDGWAWPHAQECRVLDRVLRGAFAAFCRTNRCPNRASQAPPAPW